MSLRSSPKSAEDHLFRARSLQLLGRHEEALQSVAIVKRKLGRAGSVWQEEGLALEALGRIEEAVASFQQFLTFAPEQGQIHLRLGKCLFDLGRYQESIASCDRAIQLLPKASRAWFYKAAALGRLGHLDEAIECLNRAITHDPQDPEAHILRGVFYSQLENPAKALEDYDRVLQLEPDQVQTMRYKAQLLGSIGRSREAKSWTAAANEIAALIAQEPLDHAESSLTEALAADANNAVAARALASLYHQSGRLSEAIEQYRRAIVGRPREPRLWSDCESPGPSSARRTRQPNVIGKRWRSTPHLGRPSGMPRSVRPSGGIPGGARALFSCVVAGRRKRFSVVWLWRRVVPPGARGRGD